MKMSKKFKKDYNTLKLCDAHENMRSQFISILLLSRICWFALQGVSLQRIYIQNAIRDACYTALLILSVLECWNGRLTMPKKQIASIQVSMCVRRITRNWAQDMSLYVWQYSTRRPVVLQCIFLTVVLQSLKPSSAFWTTHTNTF